MPDRRKSKRTDKPDRRIDQEMRAYRDRITERNPPDFHAMTGGESTLDKIRRERKKSKDRG